MILVRGGQIVTPTGLNRDDILIDRGVIVSIGSIPSTEAQSVVEAEDCWVGPGFVDIHVHFREPGQTWKEDMESGSRAAAAGGFTAVVIMPNTTPAVDNPEMVESLLNRSRSIGLVDISVAAALTKGRRGEELVDMRALHEAGVLIFTDDGDCLTDVGLMREALRQTTLLERAVISQHAEDHSRTATGHMHEGAVSRSLGLGGLSSSAEYDMVARDLDLVRAGGGRYHCQHVSTTETIDLVRVAKEEGLDVTAEVTPHHLSFIDEDVETVGADLKMYPPVRSAADRESLRAALQTGVIDLVATDHAPHSPDEKSVAFEEAPRGVIGLETSAAVANEVLGDGRRFFEVMSVVPARMADFASHGLYPEVGGPANLVVFDPNATWVPSAFVSRSQNSPYRGQELKGKVLATIHDGEISYRAEASDVQD